MEITQSIVHVDVANFDAEVTSAKGPVVVEFWTDGCKPCQKLGTIIRRYAGQLKVAPCNVDENSELAAQYGVQVIPTLLFFKDGEITDRAMGTFNDIDEAEVEAKCQRLIAA